MCMQYLNKFFGGSNRRRSNATVGNTSPPPSSAHMPQVSLDTVRTAKSAKSVKSAKSAKSGKSAVTAASRNPVNMGNQMAASQNSMGSEMMKTSMAGTSGAVLSDTVNATGEVAAPSAAPASGSGTGVNQRSWWGYFGMNRKKKSSIESL